MSSKPTPLYKTIASLLEAVENCQRSSNGTWEGKHRDNLETLVDSFMPSGAGIDRGTKLDIGDSKPNRLVFSFSFHHMNDNGMYDGWTEHKLIIKPSLAFDFDLRITGKDRNQVKDYLYETYGCALRQLVWQTDDGKWHSDVYEPHKTVGKGEIMKTRTKVKVSELALLARVNRKLAKEDIHKFLDMESFARELGVLQAWEELDK